MPKVKDYLRRAKMAGRAGDTDIVHVNEAEKAMLKAAGGAGTRNPETGLLEYKYGGNVSEGGKKQGGADAGGQGPNGGGQDRDRGSLGSGSFNDSGTQARDPAGPQGAISGGSGKGPGGLPGGDSKGGLGKSGEKAQPSVSQPSAPVANPLDSPPPASAPFQARGTVVKTPTRQATPHNVAVAIGTGLAHLAAPGALGLMGQVATSPEVTGEEDAVGLGLNYEGPVGTGYRVEQEGTGVTRKPLEDRLLPGQLKNPPAPVPAPTTPKPTTPQKPPKPPKPTTPKPVTPTPTEGTTLLDTAGGTLVAAKSGRKKKSYS